jgi:hypothetical protein
MPDRQHCVDLAKHCQKQECNDKGENRRCIIECGTRKLIAAREKYMAAGGLPDSEAQAKVPYGFRSTSIPFAYTPPTPLSKEDRINAGNKSASKKAEDLYRYLRFQEKGLYD